jgi:hypothetical protein
VSSAMRFARETIRNGRRELANGVEATIRIRRARAGRPGIGHSQPSVKGALEALVEPLTRSGPTSPLRWTCKSRAKLTAALTTQVAREFHHGGASAARVGLSAESAPQQS